MVEPGVRDVVEALPDDAIADLRDVSHYLVANSLFRDVRTNPYSRLEHPERAIEIGDSRFPDFWGGCGFRCSSSS